MEEEEEEKKERKPGPTKGADLRNDIEITFEEAYMGVRKQINISREEVCDVCHGNGAKPGSKIDTCTTCRRNSDKLDKFNRLYLDKCKLQKLAQLVGGTGKIIREPCEKCKGKGRIRKQTKISVTIPAGIDDRSNSSAKERRCATVLIGGPKGDLYIVVHIKHHAVYVRKDINVLCDIPVTITQATLGADLEIPMVDGSKEIYRIPEGTQTGTKFRIKQKGFTSINGRYKGDFVFTVIVQTPKKLSKEQRDLLEKLATTMNEQPPVRKKGIFG